MIAHLQVSSYMTFIVFLAEDPVLVCPLASIVRQFSCTTTKVH